MKYEQTTLEQGFPIEDPPIIPSDWVFRRYTLCHSDHIILNVEQGQMVVCPECGERFGVGVVFGAKVRKDVNDTVFLEYLRRLWREGWQ